MGRRDCEGQNSATETLTEVTKYLRKPIKKHVKAVGARLLDPAEKQGPCDY